MLHSHATKFFYLQISFMNLGRFNACLNLRFLPWHVSRICLLGVMFGSVVEMSR